MTNAWLDANQQHLTAALNRVRATLERHMKGGPDETTPESAAEHNQWPEELPAPALDRVCLTFGLSPFERDVLLLAAGPELDGSFGVLGGRGEGAPSVVFPTFALALAALPGAHWSATAPSGPLRHWRLVELAGEGSVMASPLRIDERILHELTGCPYSDERLVPLIEPLFAVGALAPSHHSLAEQAVTAWSQSVAVQLPVIELSGGDRATRRAVAATSCAELGLGLHALAAELLPASPADLDTLVRLWDRESALAGSALLLECDSLDAAEPGRLLALRRFIDRSTSPLIVAGPDHRTPTELPAVVLDVPVPTAAEERVLWEEAVGPAAAALNGELDRLVNHFRLGADGIRSAVAQATATGTDVGDSLWNACRRQTRPALDQLAQRLESTVGWDDLVVPELQLRTLKEIAAHVRHRARVYEEWGFGERGARGLAVTALFTGPSGTGKTLAAEVLANELRLDAYRIDLAMVVSKYIGETEKNLRRVFDAAEGSGAILLFDEADALFGKRSEVRDSHDRYANIEVSYLLQRMEAYRGLAILTTNLKNAIDPAFMRRLRFVVKFPFPDAAMRAQIWRRVFPAATPTEGLDYEALASLNVTGGTIRNIALRAAFLAAGRDGPVGGGQIAEAAQSEYSKLDRVLTPASRQTGA